jgi:hypothetical protein
MLPLNKQLLTNTFCLLDFFLSENIIKPNNPRFMSVYVSNFRELRAKFTQSYGYIQEWDTSVPRQKYQMASFSPMLVKLKAYYSANTKRLDQEEYQLQEVDKNILTPRNPNADIDASIIGMDRYKMMADEQMTRNYENADKDSYSSILTREDSVMPTVFDRKIDGDYVSLCFHLVQERVKAGYRFLYVILHGAVVFATKVSEAGIPENCYLEIPLTQPTTTIQLRLRHESGKDEVIQTRLTLVDNYEGNIELRKFRIDVMEKVIIPLRTYMDGSEEEQSLSQCDLEVSVLLSYARKTNLDDFSDTIEKHQELMFVENYWRVKKRWSFPNYVEQNSLITNQHYEQIKADYSLNNPNTDYCWSTFDLFIERGFDMVPLCKAMILSIFYADTSISDKIPMLWDTLVFFEKLQTDHYFSQNTIESDSVQYFTRTICEGTWISLPEYAAENVVDYIFYGQIPSVRRALYVSPLVV